MADIQLSTLSTYDSGLGEGAAEILAHDPASQRLFVINANFDSIDVLDVSNPASPQFLFSIDVSTVAGVATGGPNSVAVSNGIVAVAVEAAVVTDPGQVAFYDTDGNFLNAVTVGALPDMVTFTPDGTKVLVANEGEPDAGVDPKASVSVIDISGGVVSAAVTTADFTAFDAQQAALEAAGLRIFPGMTLSDDVEPEYIAVSKDGSKAFITLQEANAVAVLDIATSTITEIQPLGAKDHSVAGNGIDPSDRDGGINIDTVPVFGLYMPDAIASYDVNGQTYYVTANEGDARSEDSRVKDLTLDPTAFPNAATLQQDGELGRLEVSTIDGDTDGDGDYDALYAYGARSFTIRDAAGNVVFDSGDMIEQILAVETPDLFNANDGDPAEFDARSDAKGPEPEAVVIGEVNGKTYAFVGLERAGGGVIVFDITDPAAASYVQYIRTDGDVAPEGLAFISAGDSPSGGPLLAVANEVSGTTTLYNINFAGNTVDGDNGDNIVRGSAGDDELSGQNGNDIVLGYAGNDLAFGGRGDDRVLGFFGNDKLNGDEGDDIVYGGEGDDDVSGGRGNDIVLGGNGNDLVFGGLGDDKVLGEAGDDKVFGDEGDDVVRGGEGDDEAGGGRGDDIVLGGSGDDSAFGGQGDDKVLGEAGDDKVFGDEGNDLVYGGDGNDDVSGGRGDDIVQGGAGDDRAFGGLGDDRVLGQDGNDNVRGDAGDDLVYGGLGDDQLFGDRGNDTVYGGDGNDTAFGGAGNDRVLGQAGNDDLRGNGGDDTIYGGEGDDALRGDDGNDLLLGNEGNDTADGGAGNDAIHGQAGDDTITGGAGDDTIYGGEGDDTLVMSGTRDDYEIDYDAGTITDLRGGSPDGTDRFVDVEYLRFSDKELSLKNFTLELLHVADQEAAVGAIKDAPNLSAILNALRKQDIGNDGLPDNTLTLSSGDAFIPGLFFDASEAVFGSGGIADIQIQNELGFQAIAFGNHEFDFGTAELAALIDGSAPGDFSALIGSNLEGLDFDGTDFPYLSTNLDFSTDPNMAPLETEGGQAPIAKVVTSSTVIDMSSDGSAHGSEKIGVVGATTPTLDIISSPGSVGIAPGDFDANPTPVQLDALAAEIQSEVDALLAANPDMNKVILLAHMQRIDIELALAERLTDVDVIVAGGSNTRLFDENDRIRDGDSNQGEYPQFVTNAGGTTTAVVNTDGSYKYLGRLVLDFDPDGNIIPDSYDPDVSGAYATDDQGVADLGAEGLVDPEIQAIVDAIEAQIVATESNVFGVSDVYLNGNRSGVASDPADPDGVRTQETNLGNLTADANLAAAQAVDPSVVVSIKNGGGIRADIGQIVVPPGGSEAERLPNEEVVDGTGAVVKPEGGISQNDIATTLAFNNGLTLLTLTKTELVDVLEHGVGALPSVSGRFPQVSGVKFSFDPDLPEGSRIQNAGIFDEAGNLLAELVRDGVIVGDVNETFRVVTLNFMAGGGDGYPFPTGPAANRLDLYDLDSDGNADESLTGAATFAFDGTEQDALAEYLAANFGDAASAYNEADTGRDLDQRIQNLDFRADEVFDDAAPLAAPLMTFSLSGLADPV